MFVLFILFLVVVIVYEKKKRLVYDAEFLLLDFLFVSWAVVDRASRAIVAAELANALQVESVAELGVCLLLFTIGLELTLQDSKGPPEGLLPSAPSRRPGTRAKARF